VSFYFTGVFFDDGLKVRQSLQELGAVKACERTLHIALDFELLEVRFLLLAIN
jgi:hypothetical protein